MSGLNDRPAPPLRLNRVLPAGSILGSYRIDKLLGEGGMGFVYEASHTSLQRRCAIKVLRSQLAANRKMVARFLQEARAVNMISHDNIVSVFDFSDGGASGGVYFVMEYLDGETLADLQQRQPVLALPTLIHVFAQLMAGLAAAHQNHIVHRDLKPANIFLVRRESDPQFVKLLDFGVAKLRDVEGGLTVEGDLLGTPQYMSPEQIAGSLDVDERSDIWALGVMMYRCATGLSPFKGETFAAVAAAVMEGALAAPSAANPSAGLSRRFDDLVMTCLASNPAERWPSVAAMQTELVALRDQLNIDPDGYLQFAVGPANSKDPHVHGDRGPASLMAQSLPIYQGARASSSPDSDVSHVSHVSPSGSSASVAPAGLQSRRWLLPAIAVCLSAVALTAFLGLRSGQPVAGNAGGEKPVTDTPSDDDPAQQLRVAILSTNVQTQIDAIAALDAIGSDATVVLLELALQQGPEMKLRAAQALLRNHKVHTAAAIKLASEKSGAKVKNDLAAVAFLLGSQDVQAGLQRGLEDPSLRLGSAIALSTSTSIAIKNRALDVLRSLMADAPPGREAYTRAAAALMKQGDSNARAALRAELEQSDGARAVAAAIVLSALSDQPGIDFLRRAVDDAAFSRRGQAALALTEIADPASAASVTLWAKSALVGADSEDQRLAIAVFARQSSIDPTTRALLLKTRTAESNSVRLTAAAASLRGESP